MFFSYILHIKFKMYTGSQPTGPYQQSNTVVDIVNRVIQPIVGTDRNVTMDNWFMGVPTADRLRDLYRLIVVGTIRKDIFLHYSRAHLAVVPSALLCHIHQEIKDLLY